MDADDNSFVPVPKPGRFDYVKYDDQAVAIQGGMKTSFVDLEQKIDALIKAPRAKALALTKLEEVYMWIGKGIRDDQIERGEAPLQEERTNS